MELDKTLLSFLGMVTIIIILVVSSSLVITKETTQYVDCLGDIAQKHCESGFVIDYSNTINLPPKHFQCVDNRQLQDTKYIFTDEEIERCKAT